MLRWKIPIRAPYRIGFQFNYPTRNLQKDMVVGIAQAKPTFYETRKVVIWKLFQWTSLITLLLVLLFVLLLAPLWLPFQIPLQTLLPYIYFTVLVTRYEQHYAQRWFPKQCRYVWHEFRCCSFNSSLFYFCKWISFSNWLGLDQTEEPCGEEQPFSHQLVTLGDGNKQSYHERFETFIVFVFDFNNL